MAASTAQPILILGGFLIGIGALACLGLLALLAGQERVVRLAPQLLAPAGNGAAAEPPPGERLTVVVPAYNEADNIGPCVAAVLASQAVPARWDLLVVNDGSDDDTAALAEAAARQDPRFALLEAGPRPPGEHWVGKNWACARAADHLLHGADPPAWLLFVDADLRLAPTALGWALADARHNGADLLTLAPRLVCGCLAEWLVQPIIASLLCLGFPIQRANDPADPLAFAAGPFMLFRTGAYQAVGGHRAVAGEVVEDLALGRRIKGAGLRLRYLLALHQLNLRMYRDLAALWEGWTKNWFLGLDASVPKALAAAAVVLLLFAGPWALLLSSAVLALAQQPAGAVLALALLGISLQATLRLWSAWRFGLPLRWWWLCWAGALLIGAIAPVSVFRTLTGRGWTWRGRRLAQP